MTLLHGTTEDDIAEEPGREPPGGVLAAAAHVPRQQQEPQQQQQADSGPSKHEQVRQQIAADWEVALALQDWSSSSTPQMTTRVKAAVKAREATSSRRDGCTDMASPPVHDPSADRDTPRQIAKDDRIADEGGWGNDAASAASDEVLEDTMDVSRSE